MTSFATIDALRKHADWLRATYDFGYMEDQAKLCEFAADELYRLSTPPSQGKVERAREMLAAAILADDPSNGELSRMTRAGTGEQINPAIRVAIAAITQALTESSEKTLHPERRELIANMRLASVASCNCGAKTYELSFHDTTCRFRCLEEAADALENDAESSGQGTDGACCEAMREIIAVATAIMRDALKGDLVINQMTGFVKRYGALPLPGGSVDNTCGCVLCDFDLIPRDFRNHVTRAGVVYPCTNRKLFALKSNQPSDTGVGK